MFPDGWNHLDHGEDQDALQPHLPKRISLPGGCSFSCPFFSSFPGLSARGDNYGEEMWIWSKTEAERKSGFWEVAARPVSSKPDMGISIPAHSWNQFSPSGE